MNIEKIKMLISSIKVEANDETFYPRLFTLKLKEKKKEKNESQNTFLLLCQEEYDEISRRADLTLIQESSSIRNVLRTRALANFLINDKGELSLDYFKTYLNLFKKELYSIAPGREVDAPRQEHILKAISDLSEDKELLILIKSITKPFQNRISEELIRKTLGLQENKQLTDVDTKRAVFSALLCYLRQSVGSCFATAPAIIIHDEQPKQFLKDMIELLGTGKLIKIIAGFEYLVPLSFNFGIGDLKKELIFVKESDFYKNEIWYSPGLIEALTAISFFPEGYTLKNKIEKTKEVVLDSLNIRMRDKKYLITNMEELLSHVLMLHHGIKEEDIKTYERQNQLTGKENLLFSPLKSNLQASGKGVSQYLKELENAKINFQSLADNPLLKSWEFTLASFSENKSGFTNWNLYASLGFKPDEKGGLGESLYQILKVKLDESNQKVHEFQDEYEKAYDHLKYLETRLRTSSTEKEIQWIKGEYESKRHEFYFLEEMRDKLHNKAKRFANLFDLLIDIFLQLFPQYFQEVYDAGMQDVALSQYDDSPAGFRLLYKHGRGNASNWTPIFTAEQYIDDLVSFFTSTESDIKNSAELEGLEHEFSEMITALIIKIRSKEFLETSLNRMARAHKIQPIDEPLKHLDQIRIKPWAYISGGTMSTLITTYYKREQKPMEVSRWVENPLELLLFLCDSIKQLPRNIKDLYLKQPHKSMLIHSPTHAFLLKPGYPIFSKIWKEESFTYTNIRDEFILPMERFISQMILDDKMMDFFIDQLVKKTDVVDKNRIKQSLKPIYQTLSPVEFRAHLVDQLKRDPALNYYGQKIFNESDIDSKLYAMLPFFSSRQLRERVLEIFEKNEETKKLKGALFEEALEVLVEKASRINILTSKNLQDICMALICLLKDETTSSTNYHALIAKSCQELGYALKEPILVADSNWIKDYFGFTVNPGTLNFEFWRFGINGTVASPMRAWDCWLDGSRRDLTWGIYINPTEYTFN